MTAIQKPCNHNGDGESVPSTCRVCWLFDNQIDYRRMWGGDDSIIPGGIAVDPPAIPREKICLHLGPMMSPRSSNCWKLCNHECMKFSKIAQPAGTCQTCPGYENEDDIEVPTRHLLHHCLPVAGNGNWQRNADMLIVRMKMFTGKRVIAICTSNGGIELDPPEAVRDYYGRHNCEFVEVQNDPSLREVATWGPLWERLREFKDTNDPVFYCHAKGVTRPWNPGVTCHPWTRMLYASLLDHWPLVKNQLDLWPIAGSFKKVGNCFGGSNSRWHYSGSFFWIRASEAFKFNRVNHIDHQWWGNESWPGIHFPPEHAGVLFHEGVCPSLDMYSPDYVRAIIPEFEKWSQAQPRSLTG